MKRGFCSALAAVALSLGVVPDAPAAEARPLARLAEIGPWSGISGLIGYRGRLWFVNSVKYVNHNSADLYSYDPGAGTTRYETHLFSQDAGDPVVLGGVLYWPFEDSRWSVGRGEYMATDGMRWHWGVLPERLAFHIHAMGASGGALYAATSAWRASLQRSNDGGVTWKVIYDHPTPEGKISRITGLTDFGGRLYAGLVTGYGAGINLRRLEGDDLVPVPGWPAGRAVIALTPWRGHLYAANNDGRGRAVWRTDGARSERISALDGHFVRDLAAGPDALWAISVAGEGGALWRSTDGLAWTRVQTFAGARPADIAVFGGRVYVGAIGAGKDGSPNTGSLWGPRPPAPTAPADLDDTSRRNFPGRPPPLTPDEETKHMAKLDALLADGESYPGHGRELLRALHLLAPRGGRRVGDYLSRRLEGPFPERDLAMFGGNLKLSARTMARWYLLWGLAMTGQGKVAPALLAAPFAAPVNGAEKYLEAAPAAAWAAARLGQNDKATLAALIARLGRAADPQWLEGDIVGALTALTGERFGYDRAAWRRWWRARGSR